MPIEPEVVAKAGKRAAEPLSGDALQSVSGGGGPQAADIKSPGIKGSFAGIGAVSPSGGVTSGPGADNGDGRADIVVGSTPSPPRRP